MSVGFADMQLFAQSPLIIINSVWYTSIFQLIVIMLTCYHLLVRFLSSPSLVSQLAITSL